MVARWGGVALSLTTTIIAALLESAMVPPPTQTTPQPTRPTIPAPNAPQPSALARLSLRDKLLLAQAVHEIGTTPPDWGRVSALLLSHPLIRQQSRLEQAASSGLTLGRIFGTRECERAWTALMRQRGLVLSKEEQGETPKAKEARGAQPRMDRKAQLALAQLIYAERMEELKEHIKEKEQMFKNLIKEIDEIKQGKADAKLEMELRIELDLLAKGQVGPQGVQAVTTPKAPRSIKGRARGESLVDTPRSDITASGPNSSSKKSTDGKKKDRRASMDNSSPTKASGTQEPLQTPAAEAAAPTAATDEAAAAPGAKESAEQPATEAQEAVVSAAEKLDANVQDAAEKVVEAETQLQLTAQAEGEAPVEAAVAPQTEEVASAPVEETSGAKRKREDDSRPHTPERKKSKSDEAVEDMQVDEEQHEKTSTASQAAAEAEEQPVEAASPKDDSLSEPEPEAEADEEEEEVARSERAPSTKDEDEEATEKAKRKTVQVLLMLLTQVSNHTHGNLFQGAIKEQDAPDYYTLVRRPMDLKSIKTKIKEGAITHASQLRRALTQMFANSLIYNRPGTEVHRMASEMSAASEEIMDRFDVTQTFSSRR